MNFRILDRILQNLNMRVKVANAQQTAEKPRTNARQGVCVSESTELQI